MKWWLGTISYMMLFLVIGTFSYMKMDFLWKGVQIVATIEHTEHSPLIQIKGNAKNATYISLNGREIFIGPDGTFIEPVALLPGLSVLTLNAQDKFGKTTEKKMELMYKESTGSVAYNEIEINNN